MKPIFSKTTECFLLVAKLSDDKMKLFLDVEPIIPPPPPAAPEPAEAPKDKAPAATTPPPKEETKPGPPPKNAPAQAKGAPPAAQTAAPKPAATAKEAPPALPVRPVTRDDLLAVLKEFANVEMINVGVIDDIAACISRGERIEERRIAKGEEPQVGADGKILYLVKRYTGEVEIRVDEKGVADLKVLHLFDNITQGTTVARVYAPKNGIDGKDALGKPIPSKPGKPCKIGLDRTLSLKDSTDKAESYQVVVAEADGYLSEESGKISIKTELVVAGDLDFHMGTIDFIGSVRVKGDVLPGFSVRAKRGIVVTGSVREASLHCTDGDITVKEYVYGGETAKVVCGRNFDCSVAQELEAEVVGNITIHKEAVDCKLRTQSTLMMTKGALMGGQTFCVCGAEARILGNEAGQETAIRLCNDVEMTAEYGVLVANIENHERALKMIDLHLGPFAINPQRVEVLSGPYRAKMEKLLAKKKEVTLSHQRLLRKKEEMVQGAHANPVLRLNFLQKLYDGVMVYAEDQCFSSKVPLDGPASLDYVQAEHKFKVGELKGLECTIHNAAKPQGG